MYSATYISDFDSDEDNYPYYDSAVGANYDHNSSNISSCSTQDLQSPRVYEFGKFEENYGWIQCQSKTYPGRVYYHNTRSGCNTWYRPVSQFVNIPFVSVSKVNCTDDTLESTNDLELMSVSDEEKEQVSARDCHKSLTDAMDIMVRYYYTSQILDTDDSSTNLIDDGNDYYKGKQEDDEDNNVNDSPLYIMNFLESEFFVKDTEEKTDRMNSPLSDNTSDTSSLQMKSTIYSVPRLKRISSDCQLIKPRRTYVTKEKPGPKKIVSDMYGIRTISYDLPEPDEVCAAVGVKISTLSASDSDSEAVIPPSPSRRVKKTWSLESGWHDIEKNLHQPLLSDSSSSPSSRSNTTNSSSSSSRSSDSSSSSCSCSSCNSASA
ncbi:hypothetical protein ALC62_08967 [Cyphomyrmex costatus]|uniref:WW domain-containing protein n=1 Tax=Cyphomyrmex costatus TaxID=456900 RepID=A0A151IGA3_9HYME|nr:hypothetical protein ALC62_08967 [Cyphomyrmex costatus]